jgi:hypothetical protein
MFFRNFGTLLILYTHVIELMCCVHACEEEPRPGVSSMPAVRGRAWEHVCFDFQITLCRSVCRSWLYRRSIRLGLYVLWRTTRDQLDLSGSWAINRVRQLLFTIKLCRRSRTPAARTASSRRREPSPRLPVHHSYALRRSASSNIMKHS